MKKKEAQKIIDASIASMKKSIVTRKAGFHSNDSVLLAKSTDEKTVELQKASDDLYLMSKICRKPVKELKLYKSFIGKFGGRSELAKAMNLSTMADFVPTSLSNDIVQLIEIERKVANLFNAITMPTSPFQIPANRGRQTAYLIGEGADATKSDITDGKITFTASKIATASDVTYELDEDAIQATLPLIKSEIAMAQAVGEEASLVRGCSDNSIESDNTTASDVRRAVASGLIKSAIVASSTRDMSTFTAENLLAMRGDMGKYGVRPSELAWIASVKTLNKLMLVKDASGNLLFATADKYGAPTNTTGSVGKVFGSDVIASEQMREDLTATGTYDGVTTTYTGLLLVNKRCFLRGIKRGLLIETDRNVLNQTHTIVATQRQDFQKLYGTDKVISYGVKIS